MLNPPTFREMNLNVFRGMTNPHVLFQPRFEPWFEWNRQFKSLPAVCQAFDDVREVYDAVGCGMRYMHYYTSVPSPVVERFTNEVRIETHEQGNKRHTFFHTPYGVLCQSCEFSVDKVWRVVDYCGKSADDLPALQWLLERRMIEFDADHFHQGDEFIGDRGVPQFWVPKSPYLALCQQWMNFEPFMYAMADVPQRMEELMEVIDRSYDRLYEQLTASGLVEIVNFGENVAEAHWSPAYFERYMLPWAHRRVGQLRAVGIYSHIHIDGYFRTLIPLIQQLPHDGLEALTPQPQGDVTLEEMARACEGKVLLDGIPAVLFLEHHPRNQLEACVKRLVDLIGQRLVLGISDELPEAGGEEAFDRLRWVADYCRSAKAST